MKKRIFQPELNYKNKRIDKFLSEKNKDLSRSFIQKLIKKGKIKVNDNIITKKSYQIKQEDQISMEIPSSRKSKIKPQKMDLNIIFEDKDIIVLNKKSGRVVHPAPGHWEDTLVNGLLAYTSNLSGINGVKRPGIVHRLDKETSGVLVVAKNDQSHRDLVKQFKNRKVKKIYKAVVKGKLSYKSGKIKAPIGRDPDHRKKMAVRKNNSKKAVTNFKLLKYNNNFSYLEIDLETGRTHQIRVHFSYLGHPVVGDQKYGGKEKNITSQLLHAFQIEFYHPRTNNRKQFTAPLPQEFNNFLLKNNLKI